MKRVSESLQTGRKLCKLIVPKIAVADPCRDHQNVIRVRNILMVLATSVDELWQSLLIPLTSPRIYVVAFR